MYVAVDRNGSGKYLLYTRTFRVSERYTPRRGPLHISRCTSVHYSENSGSKGRKTSCIFSHTSEVGVALFWTVIVYLRV